MPDILPRYCRQRARLAIALGLVLVLPQFLSAPAATAAAPTTVKAPRPTTGPISVSVTVEADGIVVTISGTGGQLSEVYSTETVGGCETNCLTFNVAGAAPITLNPGPCTVGLAPTGEAIQVGRIVCPLSAVKSSFTMASNGLGNVLALPDVPDCAPVTHLIKGGVGPDSINVAGGCYVTITCGVAYDDNGIVLFDTVDALKSTINPGIGTDCENVNGTLTPGTKGASKPTIKPSKRPVTKKAGKKR